MMKLHSGVNRVYLIGLMGAGKSTVGKILARVLKWEFVDLDHEIETLTGKDIPKIFCEEGEEEFRNHETTVLKRTTDMNKTIIACGGGVVTRAENVDFLLQEIVVWLDLSPAEAAARLGYSPNRPLLSECKDTRVELTEILTERREAYTKTAKIRINSGDESPEIITGKILIALERQGV